MSRGWQDGAADTGELISAVGVAPLVNLLKRRWPKVAVGLAAWQATRPVYTKAKQLYQARSLYTITIDGSDDLYDDLHAWVLERMPPKNRHALLALSPGSRRRIRDPFDETPEDKTPPEVFLRYDGTRTQTIKIDDHKVDVTVDEGEFGGGKEGRWVVKQPKMTFRARSADGRDAVLAMMNEHLRLRTEQVRPPALRIAQEWGNWRRADSVPRRTLDSVVLTDSQRERLVDDLQHFLDSEREYNRRYIPYHRGYLFQGPPGTGKTSIAKALAHHFGMDIWYLPLGDIRSGSTLMNLVGEVQERSMLLIEDIDVFHAAVSRDDDDEVTLSDLLNALDGIATPHGLVTVLTTNHPEALDEALTRAGRCDVVEEFGLAGVEQVQRLYEWYYETPWTALDFPAAPLVPADVVHAMSEHMHDPAAGCAAVLALALKKFRGSEEKACTATGSSVTSSPVRKKKPNHRL